jgi:uncharacterized protein YbaP (TraB family)
LALALAGAAISIASAVPATASTVASPVAQGQTNNAASKASEADQYDPTKSRDKRGDQRNDDMRSLIWEVASKDGSTSAYLFGTIHVGKASFYPLPNAVQDALRQSKKIAVEADVSDTSDQEAIVKLMTYPAGDTLDKHLSPVMLTRLRAQLDKRRVPYTAVANMRPVMLAGLLSLSELSSLGFEARHGLDVWLINHARREMKPLLQLESQRAQLELLTGLAPNLQEAFLDNSLRSLEQSLTGPQINNMLDAWYKGDAKRMQDALEAASNGMRETKRLNDVIIYSRHDAMLKKVENYLASGETHFVAVGALHLVGAKGLVEMLQAKGYRVRQL